MSGDDKVDSLRDTFEEVTGSTEVHEEGGSERGTLKSDDEQRERVTEVVVEVEREHGLPDGVEIEDAVDVVFGFFQGDGDDEMAESSSLEPDELEGVRRALCLVKEDEELSEETERRDDEGRYSIRFESLFPDSDISGRMTEGVEETGLQAATEDSEVDTEF